MGIKGKLFMAANPIAPINWLIIASLWFTVKKQLDKNEAVKKIPYGSTMVTLSSCFCCSFMVFTILCMIIPPNFPLLGWFCH